MINNGLNENIEKEYIEKKKTTLSYKAKKLLIIFFIVMFVMTILSRIADSLTIPKVKTGRFEKSSLDFVVDGVGLIVGICNEYIDVKENLRIKKVNIKSGDSVEEGDVLFEYDLDDLSKIYEEKNAELEKALIQKGKLEEENSKISDDIDIYSDEVNNLRSIVDVKEAEEEVEQAKKEYEEGYARAVEKAIKESNDDIREKQEAYDKAEKEYMDMEILNEEEILKGERDVEDAEEKLRIVKKYCKEDDEDDESEYIYKKSDVYEAERILERAEEDLERIKKKCDYNMKNLMQELEKAKDNLKEAGKEPYDYYSELNSFVEKIKAADKNLNDLKRVCEDKKNTLDSQRLNKEKEEINSEIQNNISNLDIESENIEIEIIEKDIKELDEIIQNKGTVCTKVKGIINKMELEEGKKSSGQEIVSVNFDKYSIEGIITKDQAEKISVGDDIYVKTNDNKEYIKTKILSIGVPDSNNMIEISAVMPEGNYSIGTEVSFEIKKSSTKYEKCIPIEALRMDKKGKYILVLGENNQILGKEEVAKRIDVQVIDNNYLKAAISGEVSLEDRIIISSNRHIEENNRIRVEEDE